MIYTLPTKIIKQCIKDCIVYNNLEPHDIPRLITMGIPTEHGAHLVSYVEQGRRKIGLRSYSHDGIDLWPYIKKNLPYELWVDGDKVKEFPRLFMAQNQLLELLKLLWYPHQVYIRQGNVEYVRWKVKNGYWCNFSKVR